MTSHPAPQAVPIHGARTDWSQVDGGEGIGGDTLGWKQQDKGQQG